jgi:hypothetical protein
MVSITDQPFPIARGEDGMRVARAFAESKNPAPGSAGYRLLEAYKKRCSTNSSPSKKGNIIGHGN